MYWSGPEGSPAASAQGEDVGLPGIQGHKQALALEVASLPLEAGPLEEVRELP